ncbi:MAG TPA: phosphonopyruvate decarboxylase [Rhodothermia bacterium]|nr:phosphonopyruvate decarboxylase [Rhodothermia bacterium]
MIDTARYGRLLKEYGFTVYSGVPCSHLKDLINFAVNECELIMAANEGDAVAICAGAQLGGKKSVFLCQNSGLTNATSPLTSLIYTFRIPILGIVSLRGEPGGKPDEPQHELMGQITTDFLDLMRIKWAFLDADQSAAEQQLAEANRLIESGEPYFFVVRSGTFSPERLKKPAAQARGPRNSRGEFTAQSRPATLPTRFAALSSIASLASDRTVFLATTGFTGRELYEVGDAPNNFYMVGSMGCVSSLGLGLALARPDLRIVVIDGDGSILMRMGAAAVVAAYAPPNLVHVLLDNNAHDSTGGQKTISDHIDFIRFAESVGYGNGFYAHDADELVPLIERGFDSGMVSFVYLQIARGARENLGRPRTRPPEIRQRFSRFVAGSRRPAANP